MLRIILPVFAAIVSITALAEVRVEDPKGVLPSLDRALGETKWEQSFRQGDQAHYAKLQKSCQFGCEEKGGFSGCWMMCEGGNFPYTRTVAECSNDSLRIFSDDGEDTELSRTEFESANGNLGRIFLSQLQETVPNADRFVVEGFQPAQYKLGAGSARERTISAFHVTGDLYLAGFKEASMKVLVTVGKGIAGVGQVMRLRVQDDTFFRVLDIEEKARQ